MVNSQKYIVHQYRQRRQGAMLSPIFDLYLVAKDQNNIIKQLFTVIKPGM